MTVLTTDSNGCMTTRTFVEIWKFLRVEIINCSLYERCVSSWGVIKPILSYDIRSKCKIGGVSEGSEEKGEYQKRFENKNCDRD